MADDNPTGQGSEGAEGGEEQFDQERAMQTIKAQRESEKVAKDAAAQAARERDALAKQLDDLKAQQQRAHDEKLSEAEKLQKQIADLQSKVSESDAAARARIAKAAVKAAAASHGAHYPGDIPALVDLSKVDFDDDGEPTNADDLVEALTKSRPALFKGSAPGSADGGPRGSASGAKPSMDDVLRSAAGR